MNRVLAVVVAICLAGMVAGPAAARPQAAPDATLTARADSTAVTYVVQATSELGKKERLKFEVQMRVDGGSSRRIASSTLKSGKNSHTGSIAVGKYSIKAGSTVELTLVTADARQSVSVTVPAAAPTATPEPEKTARPEKTPEPEKTARPEKTSEPEETPKPDVTPPATATAEATEESRSKPGVSLQLERVGEDTITWRVTPATGDRYSIFVPSYDACQAGGEAACGARAGGTWGTFGAGATGQYLLVSQAFKHDEGSCEVPVNVTWESSGGASGTAQAHYRCSGASALGWPLLGAAFTAAAGAALAVRRRVA